MNKVNKKKREPIFTKDDEEFEILHGREAICTCDEDPRFCDLHSSWG